VATRTRPRSQTTPKTKAKAKAKAQVKGSSVAKPVDKAAAKLAAKAATLIKVRRSKVHGQGVFALRRIAKGTRIIEYVGDRISHARANRRYDDHDANDNHTFLFAVDRNVVIDATVGGNDSRFINHSCDPNCESNIENRRVFIDAIKTIEAGTELNYDYQIGRERDDPPNVDEIYACRCGAQDCRGTMLWPAKRPVTRKKKKKAVARRAR
jgi:SET domain-containing protein